MSAVVPAPAYALCGAAAFASRSLDDLSPILRERFLALSEDFDRWFRFRRLVVTCTFRNVSAQVALWRQGRTDPGPVVTWADGVVGKSRHNVWPAEAVDVAVRVLPGDPAETVVKPVVSWNVLLYRPLADLARRHGLVSGGEWKRPKTDWPHLELPR